LLISRHIVSSNDVAWSPDLPLEVDFTSTLGLPVPIAIQVTDGLDSFTPLTEGGFVTVVPSSGTLAFLGLGGLAAGRRRRQSTLRLNIKTIKPRLFRLGY